MANEQKLSVFEEFMESGRDSGIMLSLLSIVFPLISAIATGYGVVNLMGTSVFAYISAVSVAGVAFFFTATFYRMYLVRYPQLARDKRRGLWGLMILFAIFAMCLTTPFSVVAFGGSTALRKSMEGAEREADERVRDHLKPLRAEQSLALALDSYAKDFKNLAAQEENGAFTGVTGRGSAAVTFATVGQSIETMRDQVASNKPVVDRFKGQADLLLRHMRQVTYLNASQQDKQVLFATDVNSLNDLLSQMDAASVAPTVQQTARSLDSIAQLQVSDVKTEVGAKQTEAIAKATVLVGRVRAEIDTAAQTARSVNGKDVAPLTFMDQGEATVRYASSILYAYAAAIALDFAPMFFLFSNAAFKDIGRGQRRRKSDGETATRVTLLDNRRR
jgi:hypothetical protein